MASRDEPKTPCRTPTRGRHGVTNIPTWKYEAVRAEILRLVGGAGAEGFAFAALAEAVALGLGEEACARLGSVGWHVATVKLNMEVAGELVRLGGRGPQRLALAPGPPRPEPDTSTLTRPIQPMPDDVAAALEARGLRPAYDARPAYQRNDYLAWIGRARRAPTRAARLAQMLAELAAGDVYMKMPWRGRRH